MDLTKTHGMDMDSLLRIRPMVQTWTDGPNMNSWYRHGLTVLAKTHGMKKNYGFDNTQLVTVQQVIG